MAARRGTGKNPGSSKLSYKECNIRGALLRNEPMSLHTSLKVGGPADLFAIPEDEADLQQLLKFLKDREIPWLAIGRGYNLLVLDSGFRGAIISLEKFNRIEMSGENKILAGAGADNLTVVRFGQEHGLGGIGFISGIPGTVGGAIRMNAGAYGKGILEYTECLTLLRNGEVQRFCINKLDYSYRHLGLKAGDIVLSAIFKLEAKPAEHTEEEIRRDLELRRTKHNVGFPSAGSFFKNPPGQAAWKLIDAAGLRGAGIGGAKVSEIHSNFLVNAGGATAEDFLKLSALVKNEVLRTSGVTLEEEVRIVGAE